MRVFADYRLPSPLLDASVGLGGASKSSREPAPQSFFGAPRFGPECGFGFSVTRVDERLRPVPPLPPFISNQVERLVHGLVDANPANTSTESGNATINNEE